MITKRQIDEFISTLKSYGMVYESGNKKHWIGLTIVTNQLMRQWCFNFFGKQYELMSSPEQRKFRESMFEVFKEEVITNEK